MKQNLVLLLTVLLMFITPFFADSKKETGKKSEFVPVPDTIINQNVPPIPVEIRTKLKQYTSLKSAGVTAWHPNNKGMIVATRLKGETTQLYWADKPLGKLKQLTDFKEPVGGATFCPDKTKNYFLFTKDVGGGEKYQIFKYDFKTGKSKMLSDGKSRHMGTVFNEKGDRIAYANNSRTGMLFDIYIMDPEKPDSSKIVLQAAKPAYYVPLSWSPDGKYLLIVEYLSANSANTLMVDTETLKIKNLTPASKESLFFILGGFSKDGKTLFGITDLNSENQRLISYDLASKKINVITADIPWDIGASARSKDRSKTVFTANEDGLTKLYLLDMKTLKYKKLPGLPEGTLNVVTFDPTGNRLFLNINNARMNSDAFELNLETNKLTRWTQSDTGGLDLKSFVIPTLIKYPTFDKVDGKTRKIPAFYFKPTKKTGKPYPVIINIHGGPESQFRPSFQGTLNYITNELGIAIIAPNVRGSSGYGKSYLLLDNWKKREDSVKDIGALLDWIDTQPDLDKNRVAVFGGSYGGYMVLASMIHYNERLACGVDIVGISNFVTFLKNTSAYRRDLRRVEYGDERKIEEFLIKISPTTNAHKIKKPLFVIQGKNDPRVPASEAEQIVKTVRKNKVPVWYQLATNEGHGFRKKYNRDFMYYSVIKFLQAYLLK